MQNPLQGSDDNHYRHETKAAERHPSEEIEIRELTESGRQSPRCSGDQRGKGEHLLCANSQRILPNARDARLFANAGS